MSGDNPQFDIAYHWTRGAKTGWTTIGHAFVNNNGRIKLFLNANPIPGLQTNPGELTLFPKSSDKAKGTAEDS